MCKMHEALVNILLKWISLKDYSVKWFAGVSLSAPLYSHSAGIKNDMTSRFCTISKNTSFTSLLQSDKAEVNKHISLTDIGIIYFN